MAFSSTSRAMAHASASTSSSAATNMYNSTKARLYGGSSPHRRTTPLPPPRVTNTQKELWGADDERVADAKRRVDPDNPEELKVSLSPVWEPERGPLERRISATAVDEAASSEISLVETAYWFHTPPAGWKFDVRMPVTQPEEGEWPAPRHADDEEDANRRVPLAELKEGMVLAGVVTDVWLYHGAQVDFGGEYDGLLPIDEPEWPTVMEQLLPGTVIAVKVHALRRPGLYRWPVQLAAVDAELADQITDPDSWDCPADLGWAFAQGLDLQGVSDLVGRGEYKMQPYLIEPDATMVAAATQREYGWREPDINGNAEGWVERELDPATRAGIASAAAELARGDNGGGGGGAQ